MSGFACEAGQRETSIWVRTLHALRTAVLATAFACPQVVAAATFAVDDTAEAADEIPGDGACATIDDTCTLRAAVEESNFLRGADRIEIPEGAFVLENSSLRIMDSTSLLGEGADATVIDGSRLASMVPPRRIASAFFTDFLVCDSANDEVRRFSFQGEPKGSFIQPGAGGLDNPIAAVERSGEVFVAGFTSGILRYDGETGEFVQLFVPSGTGASEVLGPTDLLFLIGDLLVTSFQPGGGIKRFDGSTGQFKDEFIPAGSGGLAFPNSLVEGPFGILVTSTGTDEVLLFDDRTGMFREVFVTSGSGGLRRPRGLVFGPDGNLYVASEGPHPVLRFDGRTGEFMDIFVERGSGGLGRPSDLFFFDGILHVTSGTQILRFARTGAFVGPLLAPDAGVRRPACVVPVPGSGTGPEITIRDVKITRGGDFDGAGFLIGQGVSARVRDSVFEGNRANFRGGAIVNAGLLRLTGSTLRGNGSSSSTCGGRSGGGALFNSGEAVVIRSTLSGNEHTRGGAIFNLVGGQLEIRNSTISGNQAACGGGGLANGRESNASITYTTITDNTSRNVDIDDPRETSGGGIVNVGSVTLGNSILAENTSTNRLSESDCNNDTIGDQTGVLTTAGNNVIGILDACETGIRELQPGARTSDGAGSSRRPLVPLVPRLQSLADNGGPTQTHALQEGSPAVDRVTFDAGVPFFVCPNTDQRRFGRPGRGSRLCDAGAFELRGQP